MTTTGAVHLLAVTRATTGTIAAAVALAAGYADARGLIPRGRYEITVTQELPNSKKVAQPIQLQECLTKTRIISAEVFHARGEHPIRQCPIADMRFNGEELLFRIVCEDPKAPTARAKFAHTRTGYEGTITITDSNKKIIEHHRATRIGECPGDGTESTVEVDAMHWRSEPVKALPHEQKQY